MSNRRKNARRVADRMLHSPPTCISLPYPLIVREGSAAWATAVVRRHGGRCIEFAPFPSGGFVGSAFFPGQRQLIETLTRVKQALRAGPLRDAPALTAAQDAFHAGIGAARGTFLLAASAQRLTDLSARPKGDGK